LELPLNAKALHSYDYAKLLVAWWNHTTPPPQRPWGISAGRSHWRSRGRKKGYRRNYPCSRWRRALRVADGYTVCAKAMGSPHT